MYTIQREREGESNWPTNWQTNNKFSRQH